MKPEPFLPPKAWKRSQSMRVTLAGKEVCGRSSNWSVSL